MILYAQHKPVISTLLLIMLLFVFPSAPVQAQDDIIIDSLQVGIWPEYDQPSLLIIYHISLSPQTTLPASLTLRIPAAVGNPHAVAMQDPAGLYNLDYELGAAGDMIEISFTTPVPDIRIEYYDPQIDTTQPERGFTYRWPGDHTVENMTLQIQQPPTASNMVFKPGLGSGRPGDDGLTYYNYVVGQVDVGTTFDLEVSYTKPDDQLTANQFQPVQPQEPVNLNTAGRVTIDQVLPWALGGLSLLLIVIGGIWFWRTGRSSQPAARARQRHVSKEASPVQEGSDSVFCHQCGKKGGRGDVFCRACGTKLK